MQTLGPSGLCAEHADHSLQQADDDAGDRAIDLSVTLTVGISLAFWIPAAREQFQRRKLCYAVILTSSACMFSANLSL